MSPERLLDANSAEPSADLGPKPAHRPGDPCPKCSALRAHRSRRRGVIEHALALLGGRVRRCHACGTRFARIAGSTILMEDLRAGMRRVALLGLMLLGIVLVLAILLWFMGRQAVPAPDAG